ncbi:uncharacterized protein LOC128730962 [Anopheles nili]|uniref:uncharacterized protein LOC128730962 n=1 Tax=Anopheles nili TaxID=185578 RepID=UPI00237BB166|nr:uncharacterized protein LOC128730962 [Anopheles nili]
MEATHLGLSDGDLRQIVVQNASDQGRPAGELGRIVRTSLQPFNPSPEGFLAAHYALAITLETPSGRKEECTFFVKCLPTENAALARYLEEIGSFRKESHVLQDIVAAIQRVCPWRTIAPRVLWAHGDRVLVMNNLKIAGYSTVKRESGLLDEPFLRQALETLACLHAGSIVLEERNARTLSELFPDVLRENAWNSNPQSTRHQDVTNVIELYSELVRLCDHWPESRKAAILQQLPALMRRIYAFVVPSTEFRNTLNHGDLWCNNVMFRCDAKGLPIGCALVDYQLSRYVPPAYDVNLLLYLTTDRKTRETSRPALLDHYYEVFVGVLDCNGLYASVILPQDSFRRSAEVYRLAGLIHATMISGEVTLPDVFLQQVFGNLELTGSFMPIQKVRVCVKAFEADECYRNRLIELMEELFAHIQ